ncbi:AAA family ATPase [Burkholderia orbicola]|uniref:AAA family ATPase n=1 Tax=Burkholderia orbicola TaxID=2978683 RepID=UPI002655DC6F|nr:AAA family ATPase [Burkholderia orbicola]MDN7560800.1 hypothetical protein [Burkholderia orbicola]
MTGEKKVDISTVFNGLGVPERTYVSQENGKFEKQLTKGIKEGGTLCLLTGSSKTGKTTLYNKVLTSLGRVPLLVRCDERLTPDEFWARPLEMLDFKYLKTIQSGESTQDQLTGKLGGKIGWHWLAGLIGEVSLGTTSTTSETEIRERIISKPSPSHLVPLLRNSNAVLVVEDFHYLGGDTQKQIFQQWKTFSDEKVSVIVVGTTHHGVDLAYANSDLIGRIQQIDIKNWSIADLVSIARLGFQELSIEFPEKIMISIANECAGLPIVMQQVCGQLFEDKGRSELQVGSAVAFQEADAWSALHNVASGRYKQFEAWYNRLAAGPRKNARKYNTYELILTIFTLDPPTFELVRSEIDTRLKSLMLPQGAHPPPASINVTLSLLEKFQKDSGFELLEWSERDNMIYILEPAFLFYLRWRKKRTSAPKFMDILMEIFSLFLKQSK